MRMIRWKKLFSLSLLLCATAILVFRFYPWMTPDEKELRREFEALPYHQNVPLSQMRVLGRYTKICLIDSYAIRSGPNREKSLANIFGSVDYSAYRDEIIRRYSDYFTVGVYPVRNNKLIASIRVDPGYHSYVIPAKESAVEQNDRISNCHGRETICAWQAESRDRYFRISSCHEPAAVCAWRTDKD